MKRRVRALAWRVAEWGAPTVMASIADLPRMQRRVQETQQLPQRVAALEGEVQEMRRLNRRLAELADVVEEVLLPVADRDDERLQQALRKYSETL